MVMWCMWMVWVVWVVRVVRVVMVVPPRRKWSWRFDFKSDVAGSIALDHCGLAGGWGHALLP